MAKKLKHNSKEKIIKEFENGFIIEEYNEAKEIYDKIYSFYYEKISRNEINIKYEKMRLEKNLGKYNGNIGMMNFNVYVAITSSLLALYFQHLFEDMKIVSILITVFLVFFSLAIILTKDIKKNNPKCIMEYISLNVLKDIEKEIQEGKLQSITVLNEVASAKEDDENNKKLKKEKNRCFNGFINIVNIEK